MTQRHIITPPQPSPVHHSSHQKQHSEPRYHHSANSQITTSNMVGSKTVLHIVEILGVFFCAHHLWPKGVTYGKQEDWEKSYRKRHAHGTSRSKSSRTNSGNSSNESARHGSRSERHYQHEYGYERPRHHDYEHDDRPRNTRKASSRY